MKFNSQVKHIRFENLLAQRHSNPGAVIRIASAPGGGALSVIAPADGVPLASPTDCPTIQPGKGHRRAPRPCCHQAAAQQRSM
jgi:hypothetical protein